MIRPLWMLSALVIAIILVSGCIQIAPKRDALEVCNHVRLDQSRSEVLKAYPHPDNTETNGSETYFYYRDSYFDTHHMCQILLEDGRVSWIIFYTDGNRTFYRTTYLRDRFA